MNHHRPEDLRQAQYEAAWRAWTGSMSPEELQALEAKGVSKPVCDRPRRSAGEALDSDAKQIVQSILDHPIDRMEPADLSQHFTLDEVREVLFFILSELKKSRRSRMALDCICLSVGMGTYYNECAQTIADRYGVSRQRVHTLKEGYRKNMGVVGNAFAKKTESRVTYALTNHRASKCQN